eukprot:756307-Hanusia_phi.AAC.11
MASECPIGRNLQERCQNLLPQTLLPLLLARLYEDHENLPAHEHWREITVDGDGDNGNSALDEMERLRGVQVHGCLLAANYSQAKEVTMINVRCAAPQAAVLQGLLQVPDLLIVRSKELPECALKRLRVKGSRCLGELSAHLARRQTMWPAWLTSDRSTKSESLVRRKASSLQNKTVDSNTEEKRQAKCYFAKVVDHLR